MENSFGGLTELLEAICIVITAMGIVGVVARPVHPLILTLAIISVIFGMGGAIYFKNVQIIEG